MAITIALPSGDCVRIDNNTIIVGQDTSCHVSLPRETALHPQHAKISRIAGRWLIESLGDWFVQVGDALPARKQWLKPGDSIRLAESGPTVVFEPVDTEHRTTAPSEGEASISPMSAAAPLSTKEPPPVPSPAAEDEIPPLPCADMEEPPPLPVALNADEPPPLPLDMGDEEPPPLPFAVNDDEPPPLPPGTGDEEPPPLPVASSDDEPPPLPI
jgi:hypothetical protein